MCTFTICKTGNGDPPPKKPPTEEPLAQEVDEPQAPADPK